jgi:phospholipid-binding lipoprotein MlaA
MPVFSRLTLATTVTVLALSLAGCANHAAATNGNEAGLDQTNDPYEPVNRFFYRVNNALDAVVLKPAAIAYVNILPAPARTSVHNVLTNLDSPVRFANDVLQGSPGRSGNTAARFVINSTVGLGGLFDPATGWGFPYKPTDFGVTLALWGVNPGPYLYLPLLGPSDPRDAVGYGVDTGIDPFSYIGQGATVTELRYIRFGVYGLDARANALGPLSGIERTALDPYATLRSLYRQNRASVVKATQADEAPHPPPAPAAYGNPQTK